MNAESLVRQLTALDRALSADKTIQEMDLDSNSRAGLMASLLLCGAINDLAESLSDIGPALKNDVATAIAHTG